MYAISSYRGNRDRPPQTHRQDRLQYTTPLPSAQCNNNNKAFIINILIATCYTITPCSHLPTFIGDKYFCRRPVNQNTPSGRVLGGRAWLTSVMLAMIGRLPKNVGLQFSEMSASRRVFLQVSELPTFVGDILYQRQMSPTFL